MIRRSFLALLSAAALAAIGLQNPQSTAPRDASASVRFLAFGDMGTGDREQYELAERMTAWQGESGFDTVLLLGDNIYPDGNPLHLPEKFEKPYAELLRRGVKFYASLGNHDVMKGRQAQIAYPNFNMGGRAYYSFTKSAGGEDLVEFFALDTTRFDSAQQQWLEDALTRSRAHWKLAFFHHPLYSSARTHGSDRKLRARLEPILVRYGVAAVFSGHDHIYERTTPQRGVQYFVSGAASGKLRRGDLDRSSSFFAAGIDETNCFLTVEVTRDELRYQAMDATGQTLDRGAVLPLSLAAARTGPAAGSPETAPPAAKPARETRGQKEARKREERAWRKREKEEKRAREKQEKEMRKRMGN
jgi:Calcineurin-like phosphoesterase